MADVEQKYQLMRFYAVAGVTAEEELVIAVMPVGSRRITNSEVASTTIPARFTREEIVNGLRSLADQLEKQLT